MDTLIHHLTVRYHLTVSAQTERERLDKVFETVLGHALEQALVRVGIAEHEEICIRRLHIPVRLRLAKPESALVVTWSLALAEAIKRAAESGLGAEVVRYGSRVQALLDLAVSIARGDYGRAWAWKQLGVWHAGERPGEREALNGFVQAMGAEAQLISPLLRALANLNQLEFFAARLDEQQWVAIAYAALLAAGAPTSVLALADEESLESPFPFSPLSLTSALVRHTAHHLLSISTLTKPFLRVATTSLAVRCAVAALIVLETDPNALRVSEEAGQTLIQTVSEALAITAAVAAAQATKEQEKIVTTQNATRDKAIVSQVEAHVVAETSTSSENAVARWSREEERALSFVRRLDEGVTSAEEFASDATEKFPLPFVRRQASTRFGGLLLLLGVMEALGLPDEIPTHPALIHRLSRWVFHQLALTLVPAEAADPAVLAFAGLPPDAAPPSSEEKPPTEAEETVIASYAARLGEAVRERLDRRDPHEALQFVCHRHATIVADPGWIEVHFALVDLSTEIRRAALDLNPDYLPWLGVVVKFVYD